MRTFGWVKDGKGTCSATFWQDLGKLQLRRWHGADVLIVLMLVCQDRKVAEHFASGTLQVPNYC